MRALFSIAIVALLVSDPAHASQTIRRTIGGVLWTVTLPPGFCALDPANSRDKSWLQREERLRSADAVERVTAAACDDLKDWRAESQSSVSTVLRYTILDGKNEKPIILKQLREEYLNILVKSLQKRDLTKDLQMYLGMGLPSKARLEVKRAEILDRDIYAVYELGEVIINDTHEVEIYAKTKIQSNPIVIEIEQLCANPLPASTLPYCTDRQTIVTALAQLKALTRSFVAANDP